jgi:hypothetical protein
VNFENLNDQFLRRHHVARPDVNVILRRGRHVRNGITIHDNGMHPRQIRLVIDRFIPAGTILVPDVLREMPSADGRENLKD